MTFSSDTKSIVIGGASGIGKAVTETLNAREGDVVEVSRSTDLDVCTAAAVAFSAAKEAYNTKFWGSVAVAKAAARHIRPGATITLTSGFLARRTVPGTYVKTAMNAALEAVADDARAVMLSNAANNLPAGKVGSADGLATGYLFAIDTPLVTGAVIDIDGGALIN